MSAEFLFSASAIAVSASHSDGTLNTAVPTSEPLSLYPLFAVRRVSLGLEHVCRCLTSRTKPWSSSEPPGLIADQVASEVHVRQRRVCLQRFGNRLTREKLSSSSTNL